MNSGMLHRNPLPGRIEGLAVRHFVADPVEPKKTMTLVSSMTN